MDNYMGIMITYFASKSYAQQHEKPPATYPHNGLQQPPPRVFEDLDDQSVTMLEQHQHSRYATN